MRSTGFVRKIDVLGRVVLPKSLRKDLRIVANDPIEIYVENECIILGKYKSKCILCGNEEELLNFKGKIICKKCLKNIRKRC